MNAMNIIDLNSDDPPVRDAAVYHILKSLTADERELLLNLWKGCENSE